MQYVCMMLCQVAIVAFEYTHGNLPAIKVDTSLLKVGQGGLLLHVCRHNSKWTIL